MLFRSTAVLTDVAQIGGDRWAGLVLRALFSGLGRFDEIRKDSAMATNILTERLSWLGTMGLIEAREAPDAAGHRQYHLTEKGLDYYSVLLMLMQWGDKHYATPEGPPLILRHGAGRHRLLPAVVCSCCGGALRFDEVRAEVVTAGTAKRSAPASATPRRGRLPSRAANTAP